MGNLSIFIGKQQETNQSMRLKRNKKKWWRKEMGEREELDTHGNGVGSRGGMEAERDRLITPRNYEAPEAVPHLEKDRTLSGNSEKINKLIQKNCLGGVGESTGIWANLDCLTPTTNSKVSVMS